MTRRAYDPVKRSIDILAAVVGIAMTAPVQAVIALLVRVNLGSPVLFRQPRVGKDGEIFEIVKFRSMLQPDPSNGIVSDEERMTRLGSLLRSSSLDELPTLWNVFLGDMSMVGPRPLLVQYLGRYSPTQLRRHEVRPGITGLAQVSGRNSLSWATRLALDVEYVESRSLILDLKVALATVRKVIAREGIAETGRATMSEFMGEG